MPSSLQARRMRMAISPRLATRILLIISLEQGQQNIFLGWVQACVPLMILGARLSPLNGIADGVLQWTELESRLDRPGNIHAREASILHGVGDPDRHIAPGRHFML